MAAVRGVAGRRHDHGAGPAPGRPDTVARVQRNLAVARILCNDTFRYAGASQRRTASADQYDLRAAAGRRPARSCPHPPSKLRHPGHRPDRRRPRVDPLLANAARLCLRGFVRCPALLVAAAARAADSNGILFAVVVQPSSTFAEWEAATFDDGGASRWCILNPWLTRTVFVASRDQQGEPGKYINAVFCTSVDSAGDGAAARGMLADADPAFYWL